MSKFAFVILHYNTIEDTHNCVDSIRKYVLGAEYHIIIVDNCSPNQSGPILKDEYERADDVTVVLNEENLGFARGNNVGFRFAKYELKADFIVLLNSDTLLLDDLFVDLVEKEYKKSEFAVLGPMIKKTDTPFPVKMGRNSIMSKKECLWFIFKLQCYYFMSFIGIDTLFRRSKNVNAIKNETPIRHKRKENVQLEGCFLIFSKKYFNRFDGLNPKTFLYLEEALLFLRLQRNGLISVYLPDLQILHLGQGSTNTVYNSYNKKRRFCYKQSIKSAIVYYRELCS